MEENKNFYVYEYIIKDTEEIFYVGKGRNNRAYEGKRNKFCEDMKNTHNYYINIYRENLTEQEAFQEEINRIKYIRENFPNYRLTNQTDGGEGITGYVMSDYEKEKRSISSKKLWKNEEFRERQLKVRKDENGVYKSKEFRDKISKIVQGENNPNYGHYWTEEMKQKLSQKRKANGKSKGGNNARSVKIVNEDENLLFLCKKDAMEYYLETRSHINTMLNKGILKFYDENKHKDYKIISYDNYVHAKN